MGAGPRVPRRPFQLGQRRVVPPVRSRLPADTRPPRDSCFGHGHNIGIPAARADAATDSDLRLEVSLATAGLRWSEKQAPPKQCWMTSPPVAVGPFAGGLPVLAYAESRHQESRAS
eukprot:7076546-Pyramimonas_sp.AAC.1